MKDIQTHDSAPFPTASLRCAPFVAGPLPLRGRLCCAHPLRLLFRYGVYFSWSVLYEYPIRATCMSRPLRGRGPTTNGAQRSEAVGKGAKL